MKTTTTFRQKDAGCQIIRCAVPDMEAAKSFGKIKAGSPIPVVADIHFDYRLALAAMENGADKIRINPGNIGSEDRVAAVLEKAHAMKNVQTAIGGKTIVLEEGDSIYFDATKPHGMLAGGDKPVKFLAFTVE